VVKGILANDYTVKAAINGEMALKIVEKSPPDIILLDIMMPGMSGYEVCEQLKADPSTRDIPVIFLTAMEQTTDEARGFELGAADYITKPVNPPILEARVRTHLALKFAMDDLQSAYAVIKKQKDRMQEELNVGRDICPLNFHLSRIARNSTCMRYWNRRAKLAAISTTTSSSATTNFAWSSATFPGKAYPPRFLWRWRKRCLRPAP
jgi:DNA-binding response OmpR family regulator